MARRIVSVTAAANDSAIVGSSQSASAGTAIFLSGVYGYGDAGSSTITTCSPHHSVRKPRASVVAGHGVDDVAARPGPDAQSM